MSAYYTEQTIQDAKRKSIQEGRGLAGFAQHFLAGLVLDGSEAVIVLKSGRVAALEKVIDRYMDDDDEAYRLGTIEDLLDAARQLAEEEA